MKKTKLAVLFTAFMAMMGLSSCLGDPDPYNTMTEIMKVNGGYGLYSFKSAGGYTVSPNNPEALTGVLNLGSYAYVTYRYDRTQTIVNNDLEAEIQYLLPINEINRNYDNTESNAPMHTVNSNVTFFDKTNLFIDLTYYYNKSSDSEEQSAELNKHSFYLYQATAEEDEDVNENTVVLYLIHTVTDPENNDDRTSAGTETRHFNLSYYVSGEPDKIIIKFKQSSNSSMEGATDNKIEIDYKSIINQYFNSNSTI